MKRVLIGALLLVSLAACTGSSYFNRPNCSARGELCVEVRATEPVEFGGQALITITITSEKDFPDLGVSLYYYPPDVILQMPPEWEKEVRQVVVYGGGTSWKSAITAGQPLVFQRTLLLPPRKAIYDIQAMASADELRASDFLSIIMSPDGGKVYLSGTRIPSTRPEIAEWVDPILLKTLQAMLTATAKPIVTPTATPTPDISPTLPPQATPTRAAEGTLTVVPTPTPTSTKGTETPPPIIVGTPVYPPPYP